MALGKNQARPPADTTKLDTLPTEIISSFEHEKARAVLLYNSFYVAILSKIRCYNKFNYGPTANFEY
jgi:hypothetical protein